MPFHRGSALVHAIEPLGQPRQMFGGDAASESRRCSEPCGRGSADRDLDAIDRHDPSCRAPYFTAFSIRFAATAPYLIGIAGNDDPPLGVAPGLHALSLGSGSSLSATFRVVCSEIERRVRSTCRSHFDPRQPEQIIDQASHLAPVSPMMTRNLSRAFASSRAEPCSVSMKPSIEASGVRNSWLALAMKSARKRSTCRAS